MYVHCLALKMRLTDTELGSWKQPVSNQYDMFPGLRPRQTVAYGHHGKAFEAFPYIGETFRLAGAGYASERSKPLATNPGCERG